MDAVSVASREQSQGIDQVTQAITQMEKVTQNTAATAEESAAASEELSAQVESSMGVVARLPRWWGRARRPTSGRARRKSNFRRATAVASKVRPIRVAAWRQDRRNDRAEEEIPLDGTGAFGQF